MVCSSIGGCAEPVKKGKLGSDMPEVEKAASWHQVLEYNTHQTVAAKFAANTNTVEHTDESENVISDSHRDVCHHSVEVLSSDHDTAADSPDGCLGLKVEAASRTGQNSLGVVTFAPRSRSAQDLTVQSELPTPHHRSTESLSKGRPGTLPQLDRLRLEDSVVLSRRRRSFSGALHKAATAVAVRYRGLRDSLKAASSDLLSGAGDDKLAQKSDKLSLNDLGLQTTTHS